MVVFLDFNLLDFGGETLGRRLEKNIDVKAGGWLQDWLDVTG